MAIKTYKAKVRIKNGASHIVQDVTVQADNAFNAKAMLLAQYGRDCIFSGPMETR